MIEGKGKEEEEKERDRRMENWYEGKRSVRAGEAISIFLKANSPGVRAHYSRERPLPTRAHL